MLNWFATLAKRNQRQFLNLLKHHLVLIYCVITNKKAVADFWTSDVYNPQILLFTRISCGDTIAMPQPSFEFLALLNFSIKMKVCLCWLAYMIGLHDWNCPQSISNFFTCLFLKWNYFKTSLDSVGSSNFLSQNFDYHFVWWWWWWRMLLSYHPICLLLCACSLTDIDNFIESLVTIERLYK